MEMLHTQYKIHRVACRRIHYYLDYQNKNKELPHHIPIKKDMDLLEHMCEI